MNNIKENISKNITSLRTAAGLTQAELAEKLNYSDKAISKWERSESIPDITVLKQIADLFGVSVDFLIAEHTENEAAEILTDGKPHYSRLVIALLSGMLVWFIASLLFIVIGMVEGSYAGLWRIFIAAVPFMLIVFLVFNSIWGNRKRNYVIISLLNWSFLLTIYFLFFSFSGWQIMLLGIPAQVLIILWSRLKVTSSKKVKLKENKESKENSEPPENEEI